LVYQGVEKMGIRDTLLMRSCQPRWALSGKIGLRC